jgi:hypothetical protein
MQLRKFIEELLVDGSLYHVLECGHVHPAINLEPYGEPAEEQPCEVCEKAEVSRLPN